ncbi:MAG: 23S rRNA (pseudouridine(1915)-N(3))-methyltransferase RlmH [Proteobacteria bacterium]|nr:23S rRNA (pseudouridine(1915)-N(3))-methyltransferase RlmH [Pseudomonadota bacterium]
MKISVISIGNKIVERDLKEYSNELIKRIKPFAKIEEIYFKETKQLFENIENLTNVIILDVDGKQLNSKEFSELLKKDLTFIIGPHNGFSEQERRHLLNKFKSLSLSKLTFPHRLCKILLLEQIYRGFCILSNHPYAK